MAVTPGWGRRGGMLVLCVHLSRREWPGGGAISIAIPMSREGQRPGADQEVVAAFDEPETGTDKDQSDEHRGHALVWTTR